MKAPDGHWHRRTAEPVDFVPGNIEVFGCTTKGCDWRIYRSRTTREEWYSHPRHSQKPWTGDMKVIEKSAAASPPVDPAGLVM